MRRNIHQNAQFELATVSYLVFSVCDHMADEKASQLQSTRY